MNGRTIAIAGVGLIGGSLGMRLKALPDPPTVLGFGLREETLQRAVDKGAIDRYSLDPSICAEADLIILGPPVMSVPDVARIIARHLKPSAIVTDVGSTKKWIEEEVCAILPPPIRFVGSHPMAGSEKSGIEFADPALFEQAVVIVTPSATADERAIVTIKEMWELVGALTLTISAEMHDRVVAAISHLPHVAAAALVNAVGRRAEQEPRTFDLAAGGFRDTTRIASSHPTVWRDICLTNRASLLDILAEYEKEIRSVRRALESSDGAAIGLFFETAVSYRERFPAKGGLLPSIIDLYVELPDRPGAIAEVTGVLGASEINIVDIEISRLRDVAAPAPLRLFLPTESDRVRAIEALEKAGYTVVSPA